MTTDPLLFIRRIRDRARSAWHEIDQCMGSLTGVRPMGGHYGVGCHPPPTLPLYAAIAAVRAIVQAGGQPGADATGGATAAHQATLRQWGSDGIILLPGKGFHQAWELPEAILEGGPHGPDLHFVGNQGLQSPVGLAATRAVRSAPATRIAVALQGEAGPASRAAVSDQTGRHGPPLDAGTRKQGGGRLGRRR
jgi:hypothetical protein